MFYGKTTAVRDAPAEFANVEAIATEEIVEFARILRLNPVDSPETQENEVRKRKG